MRRLLSETFPGLEAILDLTKDGTFLVAVEGGDAKGGPQARRDAARVVAAGQGRGTQAEELAQRVVEASKA